MNSPVDMFYYFFVRKHTKFGIKNLCDKNLIIFDLLTSPHDHSVKILPVLCSTNYPSQFDMPHNHVGNFFFYSLGTPEPHAPPLASERERSCRVLDSRPMGRGFELHWRHCVEVLEQDTFILA